MPAAERKPVLRFLEEKAGFEAVMTGKEALFRGVLESAAQAVVICPGYPVPGIARLFRQMPDPLSRVLRPERDSVKAAVQEGFRTAMDGALTALFFGENAGTHVREILVRVRDLIIPGGLVMVTDDHWEWGPGESGRAVGRILDPASPEEVYRFSKTAAADAAVRQSFEMIRIPSDLWSARMEMTCDTVLELKKGGVPAASRAIPMPGTAVGPDAGWNLQHPGPGGPDREESRHRVLVCQDCRCAPAVETVMELLKAQGLPVSAMGCHARSRAFPVQPGDVISPASGCGGLWMETAGDRVKVVIGDKAYLAGEFPLDRGWLATGDRSLVLLEVGPAPGAGERGGQAPELAYLMSVAKALGMAQVFPCHSTDRSHLARQIRAAVDWKGPSGVIGRVF